MMGYRNWRMRVEHELHKRFYLGIKDCLDEPLLLGLFHEGESPDSVADWLKDKRELAEYGLETADK